MNISEQDNQLNSESKWKFFKKFGIGTIVFFTIKGTISTILIYYTGKGFWTWLTQLFE
jgi:hypothetical protein